MSDEFNDRYRTWHARMSYAKSAVRLAGCAAAFALSASPVTAVTVLALALGAAEILGIAEEWI